MRGVDKRVGGLVRLLVRDLCDYKAHAIAQLTGHSLARPSREEEKEEEEKSRGADAEAKVWLLVSSFVRSLVFLFVWLHSTR